MLIEYGDYSLLYYSQNNRITIFLPQTAETICTTAEPVVDRKAKVSSEMLGLLLMVTKNIFEKKGGEP